MKLSGLTMMLVLVAAPALADQKAADACAAKLAPQSATIYHEALAKFSPGENMRDIVKSVTVGMVMSGSVTRDQAKPLAEAAGACLKLLK